MSHDAARRLRPELPRFAQIEPIGRCNLACRMCTVNDRGDEIAEMPVERFVELLDQMPGLRELHLQGLGEPMLHPRFFDMVSIAAARGIRVSANTNLTLLTEARAKRCVACGLATLSVSLDGASAAVYESIRRKASFAKVLRNLGRLMQARRESTSTLEVRGVMVLMRANLEEIPALVRLLHEHGVPELLVQRLSSDLRQPDTPARYIPIRSWITQAELTSGDLERAAAVFATSRELAARLGMRLNLPRLTRRTDDADGGNDASRANGEHDAGDANGAGDAHGTSRVNGTNGATTCRWPWDQLYVTAAGELLPCCMVATADRATFGKVFEGGNGSAPGLLERWHGEPARRFREALASAEPPQVCRGCALYKGTF